VAYPHPTNRVAVYGSGCVVGSLCVWNPAGYAVIPALPTLVGLLVILAMLVTQVRAGFFVWHRAVWSMIAAVAIWSLSALLSPAPLLGLLGAAGRTSGVLSLVVATLGFLAGLLSGRAPQRHATIAAAAVGSWCFAALTVAGRFGLAVVPVPSATRSSGTLGSAAFTGSALALLLPLSVAVAVGPFARRFRRLSLFGAALVIIALISTGARASWLGALTGIGLAAWLVVRSGLCPRRRLAVGVAGGIVAVVLSAFGFGLANRVNGGIAGSDTSSGRLALWGGGARAIPDVWLIGAGPDQQASTIAPHLPVSFERRFGDAVITDRAHNEVLDLVLSVGVLGAIPMLASVGLIVRALRSATVDLSGQLLGCGLAAYVVHLMFNFSVPHVGLVAWFVAGLAVAPSATQRRIAQPFLTPVVLAGLLLATPLALDVSADQALRAGLDAEQLGQSADAESMYQHAISYTSWQPQAHEVLARFRIRNGDPSAVAAAAKARDVSGDDPTYIELEAQARLAAGDAQGACVLYQQLLNEDHRNASLYDGLSRCLELLGSVDDARQARAAALELKP
jgi:O-antigen ligase